MSNDQKHLEWIYDHLIIVHNESPNVDYMLRFRGIIEKISAPPAPEDVLAIARDCGLLMDDGTSC